MIVVITYLGNGTVPSVELVSKEEISLVCVSRECDRVARKDRNWIRLRYPEIKRTELLGKPKVFCPQCLDGVRKPLA